MNPINNSSLINYRGQQPAGFTPAVNYTYNSSTKIVVATDASTIPSGDSLVKVHVRVCDKFGGEVRGEIPAAAGNTGNIDVSGLNASKGLDIAVTITTANHIAADGNAPGIVASGSVANWDVQQNA